MIKLLKGAKDFYFNGYNAKSSTVYAVLFVIVGFVLSYAGATGVVFMMTAPIWLVQTILTFPVVDFVKCSSKRKLLETTMPTVVGMLGMLIIYIVLAVVIWVRSRNGYVQQDNLAGFMIQAGSYAMFTLMYCGIAYKYIGVSSIIYFIFVFFVMNGFQRGYLEELFVGMPFYAGIIIGLAEVVIGALLQWGIARLLYKYPLSKHAQSRQLSKLMK